MSQPRIIAIQNAERDKTITLDSLERAAHALNCKLVYALVPQQPLAETVEAQALKQAKRRLAKTRHSMALEAQGVDPADEQELIKQLARKILNQSGSKLWEGE